MGRLKWAVFTVNLIIASVFCEPSHLSQNTQEIFNSEQKNNRDLSEIESSTIQPEESTPEFLEKPEDTETEVDLSQVKLYWMAHTHDSSFDSEIPLADRIKFGKELDITEFFRKYVVNSTMPRVVRRKHGRARGRPGSPSLGSGPTPVCRPMNTTVPVPILIKPIYKIVPKCVLVKRCGGCCNDETHICEATKIENVTREIRLLKYIGNSSFFEADKREFHFREDKECACNCRIKKEHCKNPQQIYIPEQCSCLCANIQEHESCLESPNRIWNDEECRCECREQEKECSSGHKYDSLGSCECRPAPVYDDDNQIPDEDRFTLKDFLIF